MSQNKQYTHTYKTTKFLSYTISLFHNIKNMFVTLSAFKIQLYGHISFKSHHIKTEYFLWLYNCAFEHRYTGNEM